MPRPALTEEQRRDIRRNIREAAARLHADNGINNVSVRAVAQQAGVSVGTVYSHFGSLSELMQSLWRRPVRRLVQQMTQLAQEMPDPADRLPALLNAYIRFSVEQPQVFRGAFMYVRPENLEAPAQIDLADDEFFSLFREAIVSGQNAGRFRSGNPDALAQLIIGSVHGALTLPISLHRLALSDGPEMARQAIDAQLEWLQVERG